MVRVPEGQAEIARITPQELDVDMFSLLVGTVSGSGTGPLDYGATGPVPDS